MIVRELKLAKIKKDTYCQVSGKVYKIAGRMVEISLNKGKLEVRYMKTTHDIDNISLNEFL
jgi:hypothetical protein